MSPRLTLLVLLAVVATVGGVPVEGASDALEGRPYTAETRVVREEPAIRGFLAFRDGVLAWTERPMPASATGWQEPAPLMALDTRDSPAVARRVTNDVATHPAASGTHVAWMDHRNATGTAYRVGTEVHVLDLVTGDARRVSAGGGERVTPPALGDGALTWGASTAGRDAPPPTVHRLNLTTGRLTSWESPFAPCGVESVAPAGGILLLRQGSGCTGKGGLYAWDPATGVLERLTTSAPFDPVVHGHRVAWTEYREGEGAGTNVYVRDLLTGVEERATLSPGREDRPALSGALLAWADTRARDRDPVSDVRFKDLVTGNTYRLEGSYRFTTGPVMDGRTLAYADAEGRLHLATLPPPGALLVADVKAILEDEDVDVLNLTIAADVDVDVAWDVDLDGVFETPGTLRTRVDEDGVPEVKAAVARAVDAEGRVTVLSVDVTERVSLAERVLRVVRDDPIEDDEEEDQPPRVGEHASGRLPVPAPAAALAVTVAVAAAVTGRRR